MVNTLANKKPPNPPKTIGTGFADDHIQKLGDKIAALTLIEAKQLKIYLDSLQKLKDKTHE